jgi:hypothetical protein
MAIGRSSRKPFHPDLVNIQKTILATLAYFNLFDYPLKKQEIIAFLPREYQQGEFVLALNELLHEQLVFHVGNFFSIRNEPSLGERRKKGNEKAASMMCVALKSAKIISLFPFVRGVAISGSLSKNFADEGADVDFFIITASNRLWIARTMLHVFKKITFLFGSQHLYCMNYFVDESQMIILEKNIYTAIETVTLLPLHGDFYHFYEENSWTKEFLPNISSHPNHSKIISKNTLVKTFERILNNRLGKQLDDCLMKITAARWRKKTKRRKKNNKGNILAMHSGKHFSKPSPENFQKRLLLRYEKELQEILAAYDHRFLKEIM